MPNRICIIVRHGQCQALNQKNLTIQGMQDVLQTGVKIAKELQHAHLIDLAFVSNAMRCQKTFQILWRVLAQNQISIKEISMKQDFFFLPGEKREKEKIRGATAAAKRTAGEVLKNDKKVTLVVTHGIIDSLIYKTLTGKSCNTLETGEYMLFEY